MPTMTKLSTYVRNTGTSGCSASQSVPCGTLSSSTMIVIRIAITPSLNPSRRPFVMRRLLDVEFAPTVEVSAPWPPAARLVRVPKKVARHHVYVIELDPAVLYAELNPLPYAEAQRMEWVLARELRSDGYAVWQK